jgi:hypothetical protein
MYGFSILEIGIWSGHDGEALRWQGLEIQGQERTNVAESSLEGYGSKRFFRE